MCAATDLCEKMLAIRQRYDMMVCAMEAAMTKKVASPWRQPTASAGEDETGGAAAQPPR